MAGEIQVAGGERYFPLFPRGRFSLLVGDPGVGKSLLTAHLAARRSVRSRLPPDPFAARPVAEDAGDVRALEGDEQPGVTVICAKEDDDVTLRRRMEIAAEGGTADFRFVRFLADTSLVYHKPTWEERFKYEEGEPEKSYSPLVARLMRMIGEEHQTVGMLILDPLPAFLGTMDASNQPALIRRAMEPLLKFTYRQGITVIGVTHLAKSGKGRRPIFNAASSFAYTALARSVVLMTEDTLTGNPRRRLVIPLKNSFEVPTCGYSFTVHSVEQEGVDITFPYLTLDAERVMEHPLLPTCGAGARQEICDTNLELAEHFLKTVLMDGAVPSARVLAEARTLGIALRTLTRARERLGVGAYRSEGRWYSRMGGGGGGLCDLGGEGEG